MKIQQLLLEQLSVVLILAAVTPPLAAAAQSGYSDGIVAIVNDEVITVYDVAKFNSGFEQQIQTRYAGADLSDEEKRQALFDEINQNRIKAAHELINHRLIYSEFEKKGYQLPSEFIEKRIDSVVASQAGGDWRKFEEMLVASGITMMEFRERIERNVKVDLLVSQMVERNITVTPKEINTYYKDFAYDLSTAGRMRLQLIELKPDAEDYQASLDGVIDGLRAGTEFAELARRYSANASSKNGGDLGWLNEDDIRSEFKTALRGKIKGDVSEPVDLNGSVVFLKLGDVEKARVPALDDVYGEIKQKLYESKRTKRYQEFVGDLRNKAYVRIFFKE